MRMGLLIAMCSVACALADGQSLARSRQQTSEWIHIDGSKDPQLIPEWNIWRTAFRRIADGPESSEKGRRLLPLVLQEVFSEKETALLLREGHAEVQRFNDCVAQVERLKERKESREAIRKLNDDIEMECRWQTIHARDRVLIALTDASRLALRQWVESLKAGKNITVPTKDLDRFRLPQ